MTMPPSRKRRVNYIFDCFYKKKAQEIQSALIDHTKYFCSKVSVPDSVSCTINQINLSEASIAYCIDIIKFKEYHFFSNTEYTENDFDKLEEVHSKRINSVKIATFIAKWLLKFPIISIDLGSHRLSSFSVQEQRLISRINQINTFSYVGRVLNLTDIPKELEHQYLYNFQYRNYDHRNYFIKFDHLKQLYSKK